MFGKVREGEGRRCRKGQSWLVGGGGGVSFGGRRGGEGEGEQEQEERKEEEREEGAN